MRKKIAKLMMVLGIVILLIPIIGSVYTYYEGKKLYEAYLQDLQQQDIPAVILENPADKKEEGKVTQPEDVMAEEVKEGVSITKDGIEIIGRIKIPIINVDLLLVEGVNKKALKLGAGHMERTALPGEIGNCVIAGHRNYTFDQIFNRLNEVKLGDEIILEKGKKSYIYKVNDIKIVEPEDVSVLRQIADKKEITLITCHPIYTGTHRLIIRGEFVREQ